MKNMDRFQAFLFLEAKTSFDYPFRYKICFNTSFSSNIMQV